MSARYGILVIDDDDDVRLTLADVLQEEGYQVAVAADGREALDQLLDGARPDLILLDLMMPKMDGWSFRTEQQRHDAIAAIPVLLFTASNIPHTTAVDLGAHGIIRKPVRFEELLVTLARVLPR